MKDSKLLIMYKGNPIGTCCALKPPTPVVTGNALTRGSASKERWKIEETEEEEYSNTSYPLSS